MYIWMCILLRFRLCRINNASCTIFLWIMFLSFSLPSPPLLSRWCLWKRDSALSSSVFFHFFDRKIYNAYKRRIVCSCSVAWIRPFVVMQAVRPCFLLASHLHINAKLPLKYFEVNCFTCGSSHSVQHFNHFYASVNCLIRFVSSFLYLSDLLLLHIGIIPVIELYVIGLFFELKLFHAIEFLCYYFAFFSLFTFYLGIFFHPLNQKQKAIYFLYAYICVDSGLLYLSQSVVFTS